MNNLTKAQLNWVLTGLRLLQQRIERDAPMDADLESILTDGEVEQLPSAEELDELCEQLNLAEAETIPVVEYLAPSYWASYLINGDASGLDEDERRKADAWIDSVDLGAPVSCEEYGFMNLHDAWSFSPKAGHCSLYSFHNPSSTAHKEK